MNCYLVGIRQKDEDGQTFTLLLSQSEVANLMLNLDDSKYEIGEIVPTFSEKSDTIMPFCKKTENLETGDEEKENR